MMIIYMDEAHQKAFEAELAWMGPEGQQDPETLITAYFRSAPWVADRIRAEHEDDPFLWAGDVVEYGRGSAVFYADRAFDLLTDDQQGATLLAIRLCSESDLSGLTDLPSANCDQYQRMMEEMVRLKYFGAGALRGEFVYESKPLFR